MSGPFGARLRRLFGGGPTLRVQVMIKGRIGAGWYDVDKAVRLPPGTTLGELIANGDRYQLPLAEALERSPHLRHTIMLNGARCPVDEHADRELQDGDELYLLAPLVGG